jgi:hypothetical protein
MNTIGGRDLRSDPRVRVGCISRLTIVNPNTTHAFRSVYDNHYHFLNSGLLSRHVRGGEGDRRRGSGEFEAVGGRVGLNNNLWEVPAGGKTVGG